MYPHIKGSHGLEVESNGCQMNGKLEVEIYMVQPEGFVQNGREHLVCKFNKISLEIEAIIEGMVQTNSHILCEQRLYEES